MSAKIILGLLKKEPDAETIRALLKTLVGKTVSANIPQTEVHFWLQNGLTFKGETHPGTWLIACVKVEEAEP